MIIRPCQILLIVILLLSGKIAGHFTDLNCAWLIAPYYGSVAGNSFCRRQRSRFRYSLPTGAPANAG